MIWDFKKNEVNTEIIFVFALQFDRVVIQSLFDDQYLKPYSTNIFDYI